MQYVKYSMPLHFFVQYNKEGRTPKDIFSETHKDLVKQGGDWLTSTSNSCSLVATLIATVAFTTSAAIPGGVKSDNSGRPALELRPAFNVFAISSVVALSFSVTSLIMFLAVLTSRHQERDFRRSLPVKLIMGLTALFLSIGAMLLSFCAGHSFVLRDEIRFIAFPVYGLTCVPVVLYFAAAQFRLYLDLLLTTFRKLPQRSYKSVL